MDFIRGTAKIFQHKSFFEKIILANTIISYVITIVIISSSNSNVSSKNVLTSWREYAEKSQCLVALKG
jgi:hypothetical protein